MEKEALREMERRILKSFLDIYILTQLRKEPKSAYDFIALIHGKFHILISPGTIYSNIHFLERDGLIWGNWAKRKKVYLLTDKGEKTVQAILNVNDKIQRFVTKLFT